MTRDDRIPILYLAPWVDFGGSDKATLDWFRWLDRERFAPALITTQPSLNRWIPQVRPYTTEVWSLPDLMPADGFASFIFEFVESRGIKLVHVMNSRIGFDLLPDLTSMKPRPATVVQLHVEEEERSGYVRYVTTRYGNLVDAFSVTGHHLAAAITDYHVPAVKKRVIHTGADARAEYNPDLIVPEPLPDGHFDVLFAARLVPQKDPELMLEVAARVAEQHPHVRFHIVGDGPLEQTMRHRVADLGLREHVLFHGFSLDVRPWYAACAAMLMTSTFEGIPCSIFEAMAMRVPIVAPALPGVREALGNTGGGLVDPRDDVAAYVAALGALIADEEHRRTVADRAHERVSEHFGVEAMADAHAALYDELLANRAARVARDRTAAASAEPVAAQGGRLALRNRPSSGQPLVSIVVPCFNHGLFLPDCLGSLRAQDYPQLEVIVVDDASTDPETQAVMAQVEDDGWARVIRQPHNRGPSAARNAALEIVRGRYVLPVDSDNLLLPDAVTRLVAQLQSAGETVGFIYPNVQYFGNRNEYFQAPDYNLHALRLGNYCDTCSLFDRAVFDAGIRFAEDIELGHEDWDLMLQLAGRGVRGEPAHGRTLLYRKHGFTRSDSVEYAQEAFHAEVPARHPALFADISIKPRDCPGLSVLVLDEIEPGAPLVALAGRLRAQSLVDVELIARFNRAWPQPHEVRCVRRVPPAEVDGAPQMLELGLQLARSPRVLVISHGLGGLLKDTALLEKAARMATSLPDIDAVAFVDAGSHTNAFAPVLAADELTNEPHAALLLRAHVYGWPESVLVSPGGEVGGLLACASNVREAVQWCHLPSEPRTAVPGGDPCWVSFARKPPTRTAARSVHLLHASQPALMPGAQVASPRRWLMNNAWTPPETIPLVRHANPTTGRRMISNSPAPPPGYVIERDLGVVQHFSPPGTGRLQYTGEGAYEVVDRLAPESEDPDIVALGHVELVPLPLLMALLSATHRPTGRAVLLSGDDDPLMAECDVHGGIGFIEDFPVHPRAPRPSRNADYGLRGLLRAIDPRRRRHVYATDATPSGCELVGELGALLATPEHDAVALWRTSSGLIRTDDYDPHRDAPDPALVAHWALAPVGWRDFGHHRGRARAVARRLIVDAPRLLAGGRNGGAGGGVELLGHLYTYGAPSRVALWSGIHPVTGDQLLSRHEFEANDMGYSDITLLGFMRGRAPVTGTLELRRAAVPWASRFGLEVRPL